VWVGGGGAAKNGAAEQPEHGGLRGNSVRHCDGKLRRGRCRATGWRATRSARSFDW
jgi:hypothetical protein